ncbi:hypothetical protein HID58_036831 [Brassica napus]|uniref:Protein kinase domain-containing protein n=1 Tax=Brassica napus TaxID=3708 RepID=A0ABQ8CAS5_BRANA|nr:hypothetical protein HID58_036831 [Brassica napus]
MGICLSAQVKAESPGASPKYMSSDAKDTKSIGSKGSSVSVRPSPRTEGEILQSPNLKSFSFSELKSATRNFRPDSVLGEGGFGCVFKGWIDEKSLTATRPGTGLVIAVKKLNQDGWQGHQEWLAEVNYLGQFSHGHLVKLIGYCLEDEHRLLVYEFMPRGSLENHLFRRGLYFQPLSWKLRLKVALGAAKGLAFLHSSETRVIYRDFKTSNILLDSDYNAKLSDFGLAKDGPVGHLTTKSDVYSFGVVLLELLSGRRAVDKNRPSGERNLVEWAKPYLANKRKIFRVIDTRLQDQYSMEEACKVAILSLRCLTTETKLRPNMSDVVSHLEHIQSLNSARRGIMDRTERRMRRRSDSVVGKKPNAGFARQTAVGSTLVAYPRPSASPLYV